MQKIVLLFLLLLVGCARLSLHDQAGSSAADAAFENLAQDYIIGFLAWRPQTGTALGFHEYDGKITDLSRPSLDTELARLKSFEARLSSVAPRLSKHLAYDCRIL